ncbi:MAG: hypothetical protein WC822_05885, partial [Candidatus Paceibacterota bacterium]
MMTSLRNITLAASFAVWLALPISASALDLGTNRAEQTATRAGYSAASRTTLAATIGGVVKVALSLLGVLFMLLTIYAGFLWMNARGNEAQVDKAQEILRAAVIGLIIILGAYSITTFIVPKIVAR